MSVETIPSSYSGYTAEQLYRHHIICLIIGLVVSVLALISFFSFSLIVGVLSAVLAYMLFSESNKLNRYYEIKYYEKHKLPDITVRNTQTPISQDVSSSNYVSVSANLTCNSALNKILEEQRIYQQNSPNPKWHRSELECRMKSDFCINNASEISKHENAILGSNNIDSSYPLDSRVSALKLSIKAYYDFKKYCYASEGGKIYFQDMWEYCHNSRNDCFAFVNSLEEKLKKLQIRQQQDYLYTQTKEFLIELLRKEKELVQSELFNKYPRSKNLIKKAVNELEENKIICKTKFKNSYIIKLNNK